MIIAKHYLGEQVLIHSDGDIEDWADGMILCQKILGYGKNFKLD